LVALNGHGWDDFAGVEAYLLDGYSYGFVGDLFQQGEVVHLEIVEGGGSQVDKEVVFDEPGYE